MDTAAERGYSAGAGNAGRQSNSGDAAAKMSGVARESLGTGNRTIGEIATDANAANGDKTIIDNQAKQR